MAGGIGFPGRWKEDALVVDARLPEPRWRWSWLAGLFVLAVALGGCHSSLDHTYYIKSYDPSTETSNYFRIELKGHTDLSKSKYSLGFYDRSAVERLFGEASVNRHFRETHPGFFDGEAEEAAKDAAAAAEKAEAAPAAGMREPLEELLLRLVRLKEQYWLRLQLSSIHASQLGPAMDRAAAALVAAKAALDDATPKLKEAARELASAHALLEGIRLAVDGDVIVRFFDGAGNEIDVTTKTMVIFVASDVSRFAQALEQLAGEEAARQNLLLTVLGPKIREAELLEAKVTASDAEREQIAEKLGSVLDGVKALPGDLEGKSEEEKEEALEADLETLRKKILEAATAAAGQSRTFGSADGIRGFVEGMEEGR